MTADRPEILAVEWTHRHYVQDDEYIPHGEDIEAFLKREIAKPIIRWEDSPQLGYEILPNKYFYRYQPPTPAKDLLAEFWRLEKEAEKMLEGLAVSIVYESLFFSPKMKNGSANADGLVAFPPSGWRMIALRSVPFDIYGYRPTHIEHDPDCGTPSDRVGLLRKASHLRRPRMIVSRERNKTNLISSGGPYYLVITS